MFDEFRWLERASKQEYALVEVYQEQHREMGNLDNSPIDTNKLTEWYDVSQRSEDPGDDVRWSNVREKGVRLYHRDGIDCKDELMFFIGILDDGHETIIIRVSLYDELGH